MAYFDKYGVEFSDDRKTLVRCPEDFKGEYVIPDCVTCIKEHAFANTIALTSITIPDSVITIRNEAFSGCMALKNIYFGKNIETIGERAFYNCQSLKELQIPSSTTDVHEYFLEIQESAFENCTSLAELHLAKTVEEVKDYAFRGCHILSHIILGRNYFYIEPYAFEDCPSVRKLSFVGNDREWDIDLLERIFNKIKDRKKHKSVDTLDELHDFAWMEQLRNINEIYVDPENKCLEAHGCMLVTRYKTGNNKYHSVLKCFPKETQVHIPSGIEEISPGAFRFCDKLEQIDWGKDIFKMSIKREAFRGCSALKEIQIPRTYDIEIEDYCFQDCTNLTKVSIPFELKKLEPNTFKGCTNLREIFINSSVKPNMSGIMNSLPKNIYINDFKVMWSLYEEQIIMWYLEWAGRRNEENYSRKETGNLCEGVAHQLEVDTSFYLNNSYLEAPECEQHLRFMEDEKKNALFCLFAKAAAEYNNEPYWIIAFNSTAAFDEIKKAIKNGVSKLPEDVLESYNSVKAKVDPSKGLNANHIFFAWTESERNMLKEIFK